MGLGASATRARVVEFWRTVEMFSPQKVDPPDRQRQMFPVLPDQPLPWEFDHDLAGWRIDKEMTWQHAVYLGIYRRDEVFDVLSQVFEPDRDSYDERPGGDSAVAAFLVDQDGRALLNSEVLSSCAWATGEAHRSRRCGPDWLALLQDAMFEFSSQWRDFVTTAVLPGEDGAPPRYVPRVLDFADLVECLEIAVAAAGSSPALVVTDIRIKSQLVSRRNADKASGHDFLNSFIMDDLSLVAERAAKDDIGAALREYLRPAAEIRVRQRVDVRNELDVVLSGTEPLAVPGGRWPSNPEHPLALSQQLAVNAASDLRTTNGLIGVNGPPGTGKTTMLRDLVADLVVTRAQRLAALPEPGKAFTGRRSSWRTGERKRVIHPWNPELTGFEMVLASTNNGAVQNVTDEIPAADAIDESWRDHAAALDYFPEIATALLAPDPKAEPKQSPGTASDHPGWALVAARLGNKANRSRFVDSFWYHKPVDPKADDAWHGMLSVLKSYEQTPSVGTWTQAVKDFRAAEAEVEALRRDRADVYAAIVRRADLETDTARQVRAVADTDRRIEAARLRRQDAINAERIRVEEADRVALARQAEEEQALRARAVAAANVVQDRKAVIERLKSGRLPAAEVRVRSHESEATRRWQAHGAHQNERPGWWATVRSLGGAERRWSHTDHWLASEVADAKQDLAAAHQELAAVQQELAAVQQEIDAAQRDLTAAAREVDIAHRALTTGLPVPNVRYEPLVEARIAVPRQTGN